MGRTHGDKIDELEKLVATLLERVDAVRAELKEAAAKHSKGAEDHAGLQIKVATVEQIVVDIRSWRDQLAADKLKSDVAVLDQKMSELKASVEETSRRRWSLVPVLMGSVLGGILTLAGQALIKIAFK